MLLPAISNGDVILIVIFAAIPVAALMFVFGAGRAFDEIGKGPFAIDREQPQRSDGAASSGRVREAEIRQMLEAKAYRQREKGEDVLDVDSELRRLLAERHTVARAGVDPALRDEVRQLVVARNRRRQRQGKEPLDVDAEVERQLRDLENLGQ